MCNAEIAYRLFAGLTGRYLMRGTTNLTSEDTAHSICGFDRNHFSKPVLLSYTRGYIQYRDLIACHQIEDSIIACEGRGLKSSSLMSSGTSKSTGKKLPSAYNQMMVYKLNIWLDLMSENTLVAGAILDILIDGKSFVYVDRRFRKANGWARKNLISGLALWNINHN